MNLEEVAEKRAQSVKHLLQENNMRAVTRSTIDAINLKKYREQLKLDALYLIIKKYAETNPEKALEILEKMNAFESEEILPEDDTIEGLSF